VNASVVGLLAAALYDPIFLSAILGLMDLAIGIVAYIMLARMRWSAIWAVLWCAGASVLVSLL